MIRYVCLWALAVLFPGIVVADTRKEFQERQKAEWRRFQSQAENSCIGFGEADFMYAPLDRFYFRPVHFSPAMQTDVVKRITAGLTSLQDPRVKEALEGPFNTAVNARIEALRSGQYNIITLTVAKGIGFSLTPSEHQSEDLLVWTPRAFGERLLDIVAGGKPQDMIYVLSADGSMHPLDTKSRPEWLQPKDNFVKLAWDDYSGSARMRLKKMERCKVQSLPR